MRTPLHILRHCGAWLIVIGCSSSATPDGGTVDSAFPDGGGQEGGSLPAFESITWGTPTKLAEAGTNVGFTQTYIGGRDDTGALHLAWSNGASASHGVLQAGSTQWTTNPLPRLGAGRYGNIGLGLVAKGTFVSLWSETEGTTTSLVVALSSDYGVKWGTPLEIAKGEIGAVTSLHTFMRPNGTPGATVAWSDETAKHVRTRTWKGGASWTASDWTDPVTLSSAFSGESKDCAVGGKGDLVAASWEWQETTATQKKLMFARSVDGGLHWEQGGEIAVPNVAASGQDASLSVDSNGALWIAYQGTGKVFASKSIDQGKTFSVPAEIGPGLFVKVATNDYAELALGWEYFEGTGSHDNTKKRVGVSLMTSEQKLLSGPFAVPGSDAEYGLFFPYVLLSNDYVDVVWLDTTKGNELYYRGGKINRSGGK